MSLKTSGKNEIRHGKDSATSFMPRKAKIFVATSLSAFIILLAFGLLSLKSASYLLPPCPLNLLTGLHCPGCGSTRALHALVCGDIHAALAYNFLFIAAVLPSAIYLWTAWGAWALFDRRLPLPKLSLKLIVAIVIMLVCFGILRNIPAYPFTLLAPNGADATMKGAD